LPYKYYQSACLDTSGKHVSKQDDDSSNLSRPTPQPGSLAKSRHRRDFSCPKCKGHLRVGDHIIFKVKNDLKQSALLLLSPQIGNYSSVKHRSFEFNQGEVLEFYCPLCNASLRSDIHQNLALILMKDEMGKSFAVYFSQVAGEHSTYETDGESVRITGENAGLYTYFKVGDKFKKFL